MADNNLKDLQNRYLDKQKAKVEIEKPEHVERYDDKLKKYKRPGGLKSTHKTGY